MVDATSRLAAGRAFGLALALLLAGCAGPKATTAAQPNLDATVQAAVRATVEATAPTPQPTAAATSAPVAPTPTLRPATATPTVVPEAAPATATPQPAATVIAAPLPSVTAAAAASVSQSPPLLRGWRVIAGRTDIPGQFDTPMGIAVDNQGYVYVADMLNGRIQKLSPTGQPVAQWGTRGSGPGEFSLPRAVAVDRQGNVYIADTGNNRVQKLSPKGEALAQWGTKGAAPGQFVNPTDVAVDQQGDVYVGDTGNGRVQELSSAGRALAQWSTMHPLSDPLASDSMGIVVDRQGNVFAKDDSGGILKLDSQNHTSELFKSDIEPSMIAVDSNDDIYAVKRISKGSAVVEFTHDGHQLASWTIPNLDTDDRYDGAGIAVDQKGNIYVSDARYGRIQRLAPSTGIGTWSVLAGDRSAPGFFSRPAQIAVDRAGNLYVADVFNHRIQELSSTGQPISQWSVPNDSGDPLPSPLNVAIDGNGGVITTAGLAGPLLHMPQGASRWTSFGALPRGMLLDGVAVDHSGTIYVADEGTGRGTIYKLSSAGQVVAAWGDEVNSPPRFQNPWGLAVDPQGNVYVTDHSADRVEKLSPTGSTMAEWNVDTPNDVAVGPDGDIWVTSGQWKVLRLSPDGRVLATWDGVGGRDDYAPGFSPLGITVDGSGNVYITDSYWGRILELPAGKP